MLGLVRPSAFKLYYTDSGGPTFDSPFNFCFIIKSTTMPTVNQLGKTTFCHILSATAHIRKGDEGKRHLPQQVQGCGDSQ